ncbi:right-handed parallel beta-helix repeat-containing protein [Paenibacillus filicis]|uniref:Right-handed parallel beta-helix repeat-containing protein n=1 Tax=Paenibacillus gyeongsangnamensis TaxID=3388067 RepID=A0ABT4Q6I5_9BACL|nr:right-handed parallel beta-helix repeat-containing protein [Paenibacillus filicis]MCZ8512493.1 right-handed parallel beta-helix repeat-containing protein [Paenibacillus filicis]
MHENESSGSDKNLTRRQLLNSLGTAGVMLAASTAWSGIASAADPILPRPDSGVWLNVKDYGARGNGRYDQDDTPYFQMAIDAAAFAGGTVVVPPGKYMLNSSIMLRSKVNIIGMGEGSFIKSMQPYVSLFSGDHINQVQIRGFALQGTAGTNAGKLPKVERGVELNDCESVMVSDCSFSMIVNGIQLTNSRYIRVKNCSFSSIISSDSLYEGYGIVAQSGAHHQLTDNRFFGLYKPCIHLSGGCSYSVISGNLAEGCRDAVISLSSKLVSCSHHQIIGNTVSAAGLTDNETSCKEGIRLKDNCSDNWIAGNVIVRASQAGISLVGDGASIDDRPYSNMIQGNKVDGSLTGIGLLNTDGNIVTGNDVRRAETGIMIDTSGEDGGSISKQNTVTNNSLFRCSTAGIRLASARCQGNAVFGNSGAGNGESLKDQGTDTVKSGF